MALVVRFVSTWTSMPGSASTEGDTLRDLRAELQAALR